MGRWVLLAMAVAAIGCGGGGNGSDDDAGAEDGGGSDAAARCATADDCDDGLFCNGEERCDPDDPAADGFGCVAGEPACADDETCDEEGESCTPDCPVDPDADGDGHITTACGGDDCDDMDANRFPGNTETCDAEGHDEDCNPMTFGFVDADMDGSGSDECCNVQDDGSLACGPDCDDANADIKPGEPDGPPIACDGLDNDCDGTADEGCPCVEGETRECGASDAVLMGVGRCEPGSQVCLMGVFGDTCIDEVGPTEESCNGVDDDCDGTVDEGVKLTYYRDGDGDGFGTDAETTEACSVPDGYARNTDDCDDTNPSVHPAATEVCNDVDDNCNGTTDEGLLTTYYEDADGDGFGDATSSMTACVRPSGYVDDSTDCEPTEPTAHPGATEICDGSIDHDCDGTIDQGCECVEGDTMSCGTSDVGECETGTQRCSGGIWTSCTGNVEPTTELCNGLDDDCDSSVDEDFLCAAGASRTCTTSCETEGTQFCLPDCSGWGACRAASETCNGCDDDVDGAVDEDFQCAVGQITGCTTHCGTDGQQTCGSSCTYGACTTSSEQCNYCDDDGDTFVSDEGGIAPDTQSFQAHQCGSPWITPYGDAVCSSDDLYLLDNTYGYASAGWMEQTATVGYDVLEIYVELEVNAPSGTPGEGWAIVLAEDDGSFVGNAGDDLGVPYDRTGVSIEWRFRHIDGGGTVSDFDTLTIRPLDGSGTRQTGSTQTGPFGDPVDSGDSQTIVLRVELIPGDARTGRAEEVKVYDISGTLVHSDTTSTGWKPGERVYVGLTASSYLARDGTGRAVSLWADLESFLSPPTDNIVVTSDGICDVRDGYPHIVGGGSSGRLEVWQNGEFGTVCESGFGAAEADVVCRQLGYASGSVVAKGSTTDGIGRIWDVSCGGSEARLADCTISASSCDHTQDIGVSCTD